MHNINRELQVLTDIWDKTEFSKQDVDKEWLELRKINEQLWQIEDDIRDKESKQEFDKKFVELARSVYITNDKRAVVKKKINELTGSFLVEEKSYADYQKMD